MSGDLAIDRREEDRPSWAVMGRAILASEIAQLALERLEQDPEDVEDAA